MGNSTIQHGYTIQRCHIAWEGSAEYSGDARLICVHVESVQKKKIAVQYNSNHV